MMWVFAIRGNACYNIILLSTMVFILCEDLSSVLSPCLEHQVKTGHLKWVQTLLRPFPLENKPASRSFLFWLRWEEQGKHCTLTFALYVIMHHVAFLLAAFLQHNYASCRLIVSSVYKIALVVQFYWLFQICTRTHSTTTKEKMPPLYYWIWDFV